MTQRRPHWTDDLIGAVGNAIADIPAYDWQAGTVRDARVLLDDYIGHIHTLIAAVEDWQAQHEIVSAPAVLIGAVQRAAIAEAAIQRVREVCEQQAFPLNDVPTMAVTVTQILHALDGDVVSDGRKCPAGMEPDSQYARHLEIKDHVHDCDRGWHASSGDVVHRCSVCGGTWV